jgi:hypothetical protein
MEARLEQEKRARGQVDLLAGEDRPGHGRGIAFGRVDKPPPFAPRAAGQMEDAAFVTGVHQQKQRVARLVQKKAEAAQLGVLPVAVSISPPAARSQRA